MAEFWTEEREDHFINLFEEQLCLTYPSSSIMSFLPANSYTVTLVSDLYLSHALTTTTIYAINGYVDACDSSCACAY